MSKKLNRLLSFVLTATLLTTTFSSDFASARVYAADAETVEASEDGTSDGEGLGSLDISEEVEEEAPEEETEEEAPEEEIKEETILFAAEIAAYYSERREDAVVSVDYTRRKNVRRHPAKKTGLIYYTDYKTIHVHPNAHEEARKSF